MKSPRVSVLLTCYNNLPYLQRAIASLQAQTFIDFEILALDDGSTDGTREYLPTLEGVRVFLHPKNLGTYGNLNFGIEQARGDLFAIFNDDDLWAPEKLAEQVAAFYANPKAGLVHTSGWFIGPNEERIEGAPLGFEWPRTRTGDIFADLIYYNKIITSSAMFSRAAVERVGPFDPSFYGCGDWHMWLRISEHFDVVHLDKPLTFYRVHDTQACRNEAKMNEDSLRIREWLGSRRFELEPRWRGDPALKRAVAHNLACAGTEHGWLGQSREARIRYLQSLQIEPTRFKSAIRWLATFLPQRVFRRLN